MGSGGVNGPIDSTSQSSPRGGYSRFGSLMVRMVGGGRFQMAGTAIDTVEAKLVSIVEMGALNICAQWIIIIPCMAIHENAAPAMSESLSIHKL